MATPGPDQHPPGSEDATDQPGSNGLPNPGRGESEGEDELNTLQNPSGSTLTPTNPQQPLTASESAQLSTLAPTPPGPIMVNLPVLSFDDFVVDDVGGDFDFGPDSLGDMHLWFDPTFWYGEKAIPRFDPVRKNNPWFDPIVVHDGPSLDTT